MPVQKMCGHCAKPFSVPSRRSETVKFCSTECKTNAKRVTLTCAACAGSFERPKSLAHIKYCSNACYHSASKGIAQRARSERHYRTCEVCSTSFRVTFTRKDKARFCSRACQFKSPAYRLEMSERQRGEKSHLWKGGLYTARYGYVRVKGRDRSSREFRFLHRAVVEKAMLEMEPNHPFLVDINGRKKLAPTIDVHHIDRNRSNNAFANLLAVTKSAHAQIHRKDRTPKPWECWPYSHVSANSPQSETSAKDTTMEKTP